MWAYILLGGCFGAIIGSFLNVLILRLPEQRSVSGRSACPSCGHALSPFDLVPVFSFLLLRGSCRYCGRSISPRYVLIEVVTAIGFAVIVAALLPLSVANLWQLSFWFVVFAVCVVTFVIDFERYLILNSVTGLGIVLALVCLVAGAAFAGQSIGPVLLSRVWGALFGFVSFWLLWKLSRGRLLGYGDVKFTLFMGVVLGFPLVIPALLFAFWLGALYALPLLMLKRKNLQSKLPFGTFLAPALLLASIVGERVIQWYGGVSGLW